jgi:hypothetical protein
VEDEQGQRQTPEAMACTVLHYLQASLFPCKGKACFSVMHLPTVTPCMQAHGYIRSQLANNAVNGPARAIADWAEKRVPALDYSI